MVLGTVANLRGEQKTLCNGKRITWNSILPMSLFKNNRFLWQSIVNNVIKISNKISTHLKCAVKLTTSSLSPSW